jgi:hypothetical protein
LFYVADRLLDARLSPVTSLQKRHRFHDRHRRWFLAVAAPVALALAVLVARMPRSLIAAYCVLGTLSLLYLGLVHLPARARGKSLRYFPKEFVVALLFAATSALPAWDEARRCATGMPRHHPLTIAASCAAMVELMNRPARWLAVAAILSAVIFLALDRSRLTATGRRIAADLALLTPLILPVAARLTR